MASSGDSDSLKPMSVGARRCPICSKLSVPRHQPFCSGRCADIDLGRWLKGTYRAETEEPAEEEAERSSRSREAP
jgi:endogenous inhibitor of DNA gyrase (YacG/DUF329 family)